ncbi:hypothetical protein JW826_00455 [Candidatus Woesearchaeota archaeon]|nr:hypothetical protein [Candidatus Woesearchaeota archaeon]
MNDKNIEAEARSFISEEKYFELLSFFKENAKLLKEDNQETLYFDCEQDLRIQKNDFYAKVWLKSGKVHDDSREELEVKADKEDYELLEKIFLKIGFKVDIKWYRKRSEFSWKGMTACLDCTQGYGHIIELEEMTSESEKEIVHEKLERELKKLGVDLTPREEFEKRYKEYKKNWRELTRR